MNGHFFVGLENYVTTKYGINTWKSLLKESGIGPKNYQVFQEYPDQEGDVLFSTASRMIGKPLYDFMENFGYFIALYLIRMYMVLFEAEWKTLDLIEKCEDKIHRVIRLNDPDVKPPELKCARPGPDEVFITYKSSRKMCSFAKGLIKGIANYYDEQVLVTEKSCMLKGDPSCIFQVKKVH